MSLWAGPKDSFGLAHDPPLRQGTRQDSQVKGFLIPVTTACHDRDQPFTRPDESGPSAL